MTGPALLLWAACAARTGVGGVGAGGGGGREQPPTPEEPAPGCVDATVSRAGEGVYPLVVDPIDRSRAVWQEARFREATAGIEWSFVRVRSDGLVGEASAPVPSPDEASGAPDEQLRAVARLGEFFGLVDPEVAERCEIQDAGNGSRILWIHQVHGGRTVGQLRVDWLAPQGRLFVGSTLVPGLADPPPPLLSDDTLTARALERLGDREWRVWAEPAPKHPCDCATRSCKECEQYARDYAAAYFEPIDAPIRPAEGHFEWERALVRLATPDGTEELRFVAFGSVRALPSEVPPEAWAAARIGPERGSDVTLMVDAVTGEELVGRHVLSSLAWPSP